MKDRLIEIIQTSVGGCARHWAELIADAIITDGWMRPPCKVRQTLYSQRGCFFLPYEKDINPKEVIPCEVIAIKENKKGKSIVSPS